MKETIGQRLLAVTISEQLGISEHRAFELYVRGQKVHRSWEDFGEKMLRKLRPAVGKPTIGERIMSAAIGFQLGVPTERVLKFFIQGRVLDEGWERVGETLKRSIWPASKEPITRESGKAN